MAIRAPDGANKGTDLVSNEKRELCRMCNESKRRVEKKRKKGVKCTRPRLGQGRRIEQGQGKSQRGNDGRGDFAHTQSTLIN